MPEVRIISAREDDAAVDWLRTALSSAGATPSDWLTTQMGPGEDPAGLDARALRGCDAAVIVLSRDTVQSPWTIAEMVWAHSEWRSRPFSLNGDNAVPVAFVHDGWLAKGNQKVLDFLGDRWVKPWLLCSAPEWRARSTAALDEWVSAVKGCKDPPEARRRRRDESPFGSLRTAPIWTTTLLVRPTEYLPDHALGRARTVVAQLRDDPTQITARTEATELLRAIGDRVSQYDQGRFRRHLEQRGPSIHDVLDTGATEATYYLSRLAEVRHRVEEPGALLAAAFLECKMLSLREIHTQAITATLRALGSPRFSGENDVYTTPQGAIERRYGAGGVTGTVLDMATTVKPTTTSGHDAPDLRVVGGLRGDFLHGPACILDGERRAGDFWYGTFQDGLPQDCTWFGPNGTPWARWADGKKLWGRETPLERLPFHKDYMWHWKLLQKATGPHAPP